MKAAYNLGLLFQYVGRTEEAIEPLSFVIRLQPDFADAKAKLGSSLLHVAYFHSARRELATAAEFFRDAEEQLRGAIELDPELSGAEWNLGLCLWKLGEGDEAVQRLRADLSESPIEEHFIFLAAILNELGRYSESIEILQRATSESPDLLALNQVAAEILRASQEEKRWEAIVDLVP